MMLAESEAQEAVAKHVSIANYTTCTSLETLLV